MDGDVGPGGVGRVVGTEDATPLGYHGHEFGDFHLILP